MDEPMTELVDAMSAAQRWMNMPNDRTAYISVGILRTLLAALHGRGEEIKAWMTKKDGTLYTDYLHILEPSEDTRRYVREKRGAEIVPVLIREAPADGPA